MQSGLTDDVGHRERLYGALCVSGLYAIAEFTAATISGSTALLADGLHMPASDFVSYRASPSSILELQLAAAPKTLEHSKRFGLDRG